MKTEEVERLLASYYEGTTSENEEEILKAYFVSEEVPAHLQRDKKMFLALGGSAVPNVSAGLEEKLSQMIDTQAAEERLMLQTSKKIRNRRWITGIAASLLLLIGLGYAIKDFRHEEKVPQDTFTDPEQAYSVLQATLIEVSTDLNTGLYEMTEIQNDIQEANEQIIIEIQ